MLIILAAVLGPIVSKAALNCCPPDTSCSTHSSCHTELALDQMSRLYYQRPLASKFTGPKPCGLRCLRGIVGGLSQTSSKAEDIKLKETMQAIWDSLPQGPMNKAVLQFLKRLRPVLKRRADTANIHSDCRIQRCYADNFKTVYDN